MHTTDGNFVSLLKRNENCFVFFRKDRTAARRTLGGGSAFFEMQGFFMLLRRIAAEKFRKEYGRKTAAFQRRGYIVRVLF